jgi:hypothetical protein
VPTPLQSIDEIVETLKRTSLLTVLCEGGTDLSVLRHVEEVSGAVGASFMECRGKDRVLAVFERRHQFPGARVCYLVDQDNWIFTGIPARFSDVLCTWGYSMENDVLDGANIERLMTAVERRRFDTSLEAVIRWYCFEISKLDQGQAPEVGVHVGQILDNSSDGLSDEFLSGIGFVEPSKEDIVSIYSDYKRKLRGKTILQLFVRLLSNSTRKSKFNSDNLLEIAVKLHNNGRMEAMVNEIANKLTP